MVSRRNKTLASLSLFLAVWAWNASAAAIKGETADVDIGALSAPQIEEQLQVAIHPCRVLSITIDLLWGNTELLSRTGPQCS